MDYFEPKTITEALSVLAKYGEHANVIAGGTDVMVDMKYKEEPGCLVNIKKIPGLDTIQENGASLQLGSKGLLTEIEIPYPPKGSHGVYLKHAVRGAMDIAMVGVAVLITADAGNSSLQDVRIALGAVAPTPIRATKTEALLRGRSLTAALVKEAATLAASESSPITDQRSSAEYRGWIVEALTRRGLEQSWKAASCKEVV